MNRAETEQPSASGTSGKVLIVGILTVACLAAGTSWWFRYSATHRAATYWGGDAAALIRDAPEVTLMHETSNELANQPDAAQPSSARRDLDVSQARGLTHLRSALLEDFNFSWPGIGEQPIAANDSHDWKWILAFRDPKSGKALAIQFTEDCALAARVMPSKARGSVALTAVPTDPLMAKGLREMFAEFSTLSSVDSGAKPQAAGAAAVPTR